ncbi:hypothetical protein A4A49_63681, partial [Nicotiana attenuata]
IGYSEVQKGYRLYDLESNRFFVRRDLSFREDIFPFKALHSEPENLLNSDIDCSSTARNQPTSAAEVDDDLGIASQNANDQINTEADDSNTSTALDMPLDEAITIEQMPTVVSQPTRISKDNKTKVWLKDYVTSCKPKGTSLYLVSNYVSYAHLSEHYQCYLGSFSAQMEPKSFQEASQDDMWIEAM